MSEREQARQQRFLQGLLSRDQGRQLGAELRDAPARRLRGMQAYEANAGAAAEGALASTFPTVQALVGEASFAALARALWQSHPPTRGDLARFGDSLPAFIASSEQLANVPYLADAARLDQLLAQAESAADAELDAASLSLLASTDPEGLTLDLAPGTALLRSPFPVVTLWRAHQAVDAASGAPDANTSIKDADRFAGFRTSLAAGVGECALVWRQGWRARVEPIAEATEQWTRSLLNGHTLADALNAAGDAFQFEPWLLNALPQGLLVRARVAVKTN